MKRFIIWLACILMAVSLLTACGSKKSKKDDREEVTEETKEETSEEETEEGTTAAETEIPETEADKADILDAYTVLPGPNQDDAVMISLNRKVTGRAKDGAAWFYSFRTTAGTDGEYEICAVNRTEDSQYLGVVLRDAAGKQIDYLYATSFGVAESFITRNLSPATVYYLEVYSNRSNGRIDRSETVVDYALAVRDLSGGDVPAVWGDGTFTPENAAAPQPGPNQDEAVPIPLNTKITGTAADARHGYFKFKTVEGAEHEYMISAVNKTPESRYLGIVLYDEGGNQIDYRYPDYLGTAASIRTKNLKPGTVYYLRVYSNQSNGRIDTSETAVDYALFVRDLSDRNVGALWGSGEEEPAAGSGQAEDEAAVTGLIPGSNQDEPARIPLNRKLGGSAVQAKIWYFSFRTAENVELPYEISAVNKTPDSDYLGVVLCDEGGEQIDYMYVDSAGAAKSFVRNLPPDTVYYLKVYSNHSNGRYDLYERQVDYVLSVNADIPEAAEGPVVTLLEDEKEDTEPFGIVAAGGEEEKSPVGYTVGDLLELGFETLADVSIEKQSRSVCDIFTMTRDSIPFSVRAVNPYAGGIPLKDCIVCYFGISDTTGEVLIDGGIGCGSAGMEDVLGRYQAPLVQKDDYVVYQTQNPSREYGTEYGDFVISEDVQTCDVLFRFGESGKLDEVIFLAPYLLYNTLTENLDEVDVGRADPMALEEAEAARNEILDRLRSAFANEGIDADIDEQTGKITLDNSILFDYDSYRLSEDGKKYIDSFLRAYAGALLDGEHAEDIKGVQFDGHTDTDGGHEYNQKLSEKRAGAVLEYCTGENNAGLDSGQTEAFREISSAVGHSFDEPVYGSDGKIDMAASRRVEIRFFLNLGE